MSVNLLSIPRDALIEIFCILLGQRCEKFTRTSFFKLKDAFPFASSCSYLSNICFSAIQSVNLVDKIRETDAIQDTNQNTCMPNCRCAGSFCMKALLLIIRHSGDSLTEILLPPVSVDNMTKIVTEVTTFSSCLSRFQFTDIQTAENVTSSKLLQLPFLLQFEINKPSTRSISSLMFAPPSLQHLTLTNVRKNQMLDLVQLFDCLKIILKTLSIHIDDDTKSSINEKHKQQKDVMLYVNSKRYHNTQTSRLTESRKFLKKIASSVLLHGLSDQFKIISNAQTNPYFMGRFMNSVCTRNEDAINIYHPTSGNLNRWNYLYSHTAREQNSITVCEASFRVSKYKMKRFQEFIQPIIPEEYFCTLAIQGKFLKMPRREPHELVGRQENVSLRSQILGTNISGLCDPWLLYMHENDDISNVRIFEINDIRQIRGSNCEEYENINDIFDNYRKHLPLKTLTGLRLGDPRYILPFPQRIQVFNIHFSFVKQVIGHALSIKTLDIHGQFLNALFVKNQIPSFFQGLSDLNTLSMYDVLLFKRWTLQDKEYNIVHFLTLFPELVYYVEMCCRKLHVFELFKNSDIKTKEVRIYNTVALKRMIEDCLITLNEYKSRNQNVELRSVTIMLRLWKNSMKILNPQQLSIQTSLLHNDTTKSELL